MEIENAELKARFAELFALYAQVGTPRCCPWPCTYLHGGTAGGAPASMAPGKRQRSLSPRPSGLDAAGFSQSQAQALRSVEKSQRTASLLSRGSQSPTPSSSSSSVGFPHQPMDLVSVQRPSASSSNSASVRLAIVGGYDGLSGLDSLEVFDGRAWVAGPGAGTKRSDFGTVAIGGSV